ncbi:MAG: phage integrase SAM-like domain-containing protein, partial [Planctomycetia bacterium]|nr:phage integrase SAM-like domain-containing protein [Planctomycetia bacterium]
EKIMTARLTETPIDVRTSSWLSSIPEDLQERLSRNGLIELKSDPTLEELFDAYWESEYYDLKRTTQSSKRQSRRRFFEFACKNESCADFTKRDAAEFVRFLDKQVGEATRAGTIRDVRRVFNWGIEREMIETNPFLGIKRGSFKNKSREYYVPMADFEKMIDAAPSRMWRPYWDFIELAA